VRRTLPAALALVWACAASRADASGVLPFIEDDYPRALAEARSRGLPIFLEYWTAW
jgi:hypothetical protein